MCAAKHEQSYFYGGDALNIWIDLFKFGFVLLLLIIHQWTLAKTGGIL